MINVALQSRMQSRMQSRPSKTGKKDHSLPQFHQFIHKFLQAKFHSGGPLKFACNRMSCQSRISENWLEFVLQVYISLSCTQCYPPKPELAITMCSSYMDSGSHLLPWHNQHIAMVQPPLLPQCAPIRSQDCCGCPGQKKEDNGYC